MKHVRLVIPAALAASGLVVGATVANAVEDVSFTYSVSPTKAGAVTSSTAGATFADAAAAAPTDATFHLAPGTLVAHADDSTSPVSPSPLNGDRVGSAIVSADPSLDGCGNRINVNATATWVEPISAAAPTGSVAQIHLKGSYLFYTFEGDGFIVQSPGDALQPLPHYDLVAAGIGQELPSLCAGSSVGFSVTTFGYAKSSTGANTKRITQKNPSSIGTHSVHVDYTDTLGVNHTGSATFTTTKR